MRFWQQLHLIILYENDNTNNLENMLSTPPTPKITTLGTLMHMDHFIHDAYKEEYVEDEDFKETFLYLQGQVSEEEGDNKSNNHTRVEFLYKLYKLHVHVRECNL
jgi:glutathionylspermidine synthase